MEEILDNLENELSQILGIPTADIVTSFFCYVSLTTTADLVKLKKSDRRTEHSKPLRSRPNFQVFSLCFLTANNPWDFQE